MPLTQMRRLPSAVSSLSSIQATSGSTSARIASSARMRRGREPKAPPRPLPRPVPSPTTSQSLDWRQQKSRTCALHARPTSAPLTSSQQASLRCWLPLPPLRIPTSFSTTRTTSMAICATTPSSLPTLPLQRFCTPQVEPLSRTLRSSTLWDPLLTLKASPTSRPASQLFSMCCLFLMTSSIPGRTATSPLPSRGSLAPSISKRYR